MASLCKTTSTRLFKNQMIFQKWEYTWMIDWLNQFYPHFTVFEISECLCHIIIKREVPALSLILLMWSFSLISKEIARYLLLRFSLLIWTHNLPLPKTLLKTKIQNLFLLPGDLITDHKTFHLLHYTINNCNNTLIA